MIGKEYTLKGVYEERISSKTGKPYKAMIIKIADDIEKIMFFNTAELKLLEAETVPSSENIE